MNQARIKFTLLLATVCLAVDTRGQGIAPAAPAVNTDFQAETDSWLQPAAPPAERQQWGDRENVRRHRVVEIAWNRFDALNDAGFTTLDLNLFADVPVRLAPQRMQRDCPTSYVWTGRLNDHPFQSFVLSVAERSMYAEFRTPRAEYVIRSIGGGLHEIVERDPSSLPGCATSDTVPDELSDTPPKAERRGAPDGLVDGQRPIARGAVPVLDILVVYTATVTHADGRAFAQAAVADLNQRFENSECVAEARLVGVRRLPWVETGTAQQDINHLRLQDGVIDEALQWREDFGADCVAMIVSTMNDACGIGNVGLQSGIDEDRQFTVTDIDCGVSTFSHEIGHNCGCMHDPDNACSAAACIDRCCNTDRQILPGFDPYSYGYRFFASLIEWRTTMAYAPGVRIDYFSSPTVFFAGAPTGLPNTYDNAQTISNTAGLLEARRAAIVPAGGLWLDPNAPFAGNGSIATPFDTFGAALSFIPFGGALHLIPAGSDPWTGVIATAMTIDLPVGGGTVLVGAN